MANAPIVSPPGTLTKLDWWKIGGQALFAAAAVVIVAVLSQLLPGIDSSTALGALLTGVMHTLIYVAKRFLTDTTITDPPATPPLG